MLKIGDKVEVKASAETTANGIRKFDGQVFVVEKSIRYCTSRYYQLKGCESEKGVPYSFAEGWLRKLN